jgi:hypothetical protein
MCVIGENKKNYKKMQKVTVGDFVVRKLENPRILRTPIFQLPSQKKVRKLRE